MRIPTCIAREEDGGLCGRPAAWESVQCNGMVCEDHARKWLAAIPPGDIRSRIIARRVLHPTPFVDVIRKRTQRG